MFALANVFFYVYRTCVLKFLYLLTSFVKTRFFNVDTQVATQNDHFSSCGSANFSVAQIERLLFA